MNELEKRSRVLSKNATRCRENLLEHAEANMEYIGLFVSTNPLSQNFFEIQLKTKRCWNPNTDEYIDVSSLTRSKSKKPVNADREERDSIQKLLRQGKTLQGLIKSRENCFLSGRTTVFTIEKTKARIEGPYLSAIEYMLCI